MKKIALILTFVFIVVSGHSQSFNIVLNVNSDAISAMSLNEALSFTIENVSSTSAEGSVRVMINSESNNEIAILESSKFLIQPGITFSNQLLNASSGYRLLSGSGRFVSILRPGFVFGEGRYNICVQLLVPEMTGINESCDVFEIWQSTQLMLISPFDGEELGSLYPGFTWLNTAVGLNQQLKYNIKWAESDERVHPVNAFMELPLFNFVEGVKDFSFMYGNNQKKFEKEKFYYWQVEAINNGVISGVSEIWEFSFANYKKETLEKEYYILSDAINQSYRFKGDTCYFELNNKYATTELEYSLGDKNGIESKPRTMTLKAGKNKLKLPVTSFGNAEPRSISLFYHDKKHKVVLNKYEN